MTAKRPTAIAQRLHKQLYQLQTSGAVVWRDVRRSNRAFYAHVAEVYFWWRHASEVTGYLDSEYAKLARKFKSRVKHGYNYSPLLVLVWGNDNCSDGDLDRHSRALNNIDAEYLSRPSYYKKDGVARLAKFIEDNHGINGLTGYGKSNAGIEEDDEESTFSLKKAAVPDSTKSNALYHAAAAHYSQTSTSPSISFDSAIPVNSEELAVILVKRSATGFQLLGAPNDADAVRAAAVVNFKHTFSALSPSVRAIVEAIRTQCLPANLQKIQRELTDKSKQKHDDGKPKLSTKRLLYRTSSADFLLSPVRAHAGVVTVARPKHAILDDVAGDVFLSNPARLALERRAVSNYEFNLYKADSIDTIKTYAHGHSASHVLRLENIADQTDFLHLDFWQYDSAVTDVMPQVDIDWLGHADWQQSLSITWFRHLALDVVEKWFASHANHIKRDHQKICLVQFGRDSIAISFVRRNAVFEHRHEIALPQFTQGLRSLNLYFLTRDLMPVLRSIADFEVQGAVEVLVDTAAVLFKFQTNCAVFTVAVPTANDKGVRNTKGFTFYQPTAKSSANYDDANEPFDYDEEAKLWQTVQDHSQ